MTHNPICAHDPHPRKTIQVLDCEMAYVDVGQGDPIVFLHGNPTSSYLWRNIIPHVKDLGRCLAPDLPGMGASSTPPGAPMRFVEHARYLEAWFEQMGLNRNVCLVLHDWGSALGFDWARRNASKVQAIAYMEALVQPRRWSDFPEGRDKIFRALRSPQGEELVDAQNFFVETVLPRSILRQLSEAEMDAYRRPLADPQRRRATLLWSRELPIDGAPHDVHERVGAYGQWLSSSPVPKLFVNTEPGALLTGRSREFCRTWPNQRELTVAGIHYVQEDSPAPIGQALRGFVADVRSGNFPPGARHA
jgi:haloalkane dehalogenase